MRGTRAVLGALAVVAIVDGRPITVSTAPPRPMIVLATTTSTQDSGLLDVLTPRFELETGIAVKTVAVGTGEALAMGRRGDADVLLVHARAAEEEFMAQGFGVERRDVMHNDFVLVGPVTDPAGIKGAAITEAFARIAATQARFISRGDRSGTHVRELAVWKEAGLQPLGDWYVSSGQGMGESARIAAEKQAYLLIDRGTWLALRRTLDLALLVEGGPSLANSYGVIVVNPTRFPRVRSREATILAAWLTSAPIQAAIGAFGMAKFGEPLFHPNARPTPAGGAASGQ